LSLNSKPRIALDADGVLLDYHHSYRYVWQRAFGVLPELADADAYWPFDRWAVRRLEGDELSRLRACFDEDFWTTIPPMAGALSACHSLHDAGFELICVSAIAEKYQDARLRNLRDIGFPIERVIATGADQSQTSPKAAALRDIDPVAFVDDYLPFLRGLPETVHAALVLREPNGSPNSGPELRLAHSQHADLAGFAAWWLAR